MWAAAQALAGACTRRAAQHTQGHWQCSTGAALAGTAGQLAPCRQPPCLVQLGQESRSLPGPGLQLGGGWEPLPGAEAPGQVPGRALGAWCPPGSRAGSCQGSLVQGPWLRILGPGRQGQGSGHRLGSALRACCCPGRRSSTHQADPRRRDPAAQAVRWQGAGGAAVLSLGQAA